MISKIIRSALANAGQDLDVDVNHLVVSDARVDDGPLLGGRYRWRPRAMGRVYPIRKRTSHLSVILTEVEAPAPRMRRQPAEPKPAEVEEPATEETVEEPEAADEPVVETVDETEAATEETDVDEEKE
jgi:large subunit ribosomal protein L22